MRVTFPAEERQNLVQELAHALTGVTIQTLRGAAKYWGWTLRGTSKADLVEQLIGYLGDAGRMSAALQTQRADEREALGWLVGMGHSREAAKELALVMSHGSGRQLSQKAALALLQRLGERCLVFTDEYDTVHVPALYLEWLPYVEASRLAVRRRAQAAGAPDAGRAKPACGSSAGGRRDRSARGRGAGAIHHPVLFFRIPRGRNHRRSPGAGRAGDAGPLGLHDAG